MNTQKRGRRALSRSWEGVADWYTGWAGTSSSRYHRRLAIPLLLQLLELKQGEALADLGCGPGTLTASASDAGARLTGIDLSPSMIAHARKAHGAAARFVVGDVTRLAAHPDMRPEGFDAASFLLSVQDIDDLDGAMRSAAWLLRPGGRLALIMLHPCFRVPRQSGWGWDDARKLTFRRVDTYLTPLDVPMEPHKSGIGITRSHHRPLQAYVQALAGVGLRVTQLREVADAVDTGTTRSQRRAQREFPLFIGIAAEKPG